MITYIYHKPNLKNKSSLKNIFILLDLSRCTKTVAKCFSDDFSICAGSVSYLYGRWKKTATIVSPLAPPDFICF